MCILGHIWKIEVKVRIKELWLWHYNSDDAQSWQFSKPLSFKYLLSLFARIYLLFYFFKVLVSASPNNNLNQYVLCWTNKEKEKKRALPDVMHNIEWHTIKSVLPINDCTWIFLCLFTINHLMMHKELNTRSAPSQSYLTNSVILLLSLDVQ